MTRKQLRESLAPFSKKSYCMPLAAKLLGSVLMAMVTSALLIIGHDPATKTALAIYVWFARTTQSCVASDPTCGGRDFHEGNHYDVVTHS